MMADAVLNVRQMSTAHRNLAAFGQTRRPYRARDIPALLYSDLSKCARTITAREAYLEASYVGLLRRRF